MSRASCDIAFDNDERIYESGKVVSAEVNLAFSEPTNCRCVYAKFVGEAVVRWQKRRTHRRRRQGDEQEEVQEFRGHEDYFSINRDIIRNEDGCDMQLEPRRYSTSISCTLPQNLPSSFHGQYGAVRYLLKVYIDAGRIDEISEVEFKVYTPLDLNRFPHLRQPKNLEMSRNFCCWIWRNGPLSMSASVPFTGFIPNQSVSITIECENGSNVDLNATKVYIKQIATFKCSSPRRESRTEEIQVCETKLDGVQKHTTKQVRGTLTVPDVRSTNLTRCGIIDVKYVLKMKGVTTGANGNLFNEVPIVIGTVPFADFDYDRANRIDSSPTSETEPPPAEKNGGPPPAYTEVVNTSSRVDVGWNQDLAS